MISWYYICSVVVNCGKCFFNGCKFMNNSGLQMAFSDWCISWNDVCSLIRLVYTVNLSGRILFYWHSCVFFVVVVLTAPRVQIISHVLTCRFAAAKRDGSEYFVLLIITDGIITDMPQTTEAIVRVRQLCLMLERLLLTTCSLSLEVVYHGL